MCVFACGLSRGVCLGDIGTDNGLDNALRRSTFCGTTGSQD